MTYRVAMLLDHNGSYDSRIIREANGLLAAGFDVRVFCKSNGLSPEDIRPDNITYIDCPFDSNGTVRALFSRNRKPSLSAISSTNETEAPIPRPQAAPKATQNVIKQILGTAISFQNNLMAVREAVEKYAPHIIHAHDLSMLPAGATLAKQSNIPLIYDSHEYEYDRNIVENSIQRMIRRCTERRYIVKSDAVITVSDSIADALQARHKISRPHIVLNNDKTHGPAFISTTRDSLNLPQGNIGVYFGGVQSGRGIEHAIKALTYTFDKLCIIGRITPQQEGDLMRRAQQLDVANKIYFHPPLSASEILGLGDVFDYAIIPIEKTCASYDFALPNKLFQSVAANLPLIVTPLSEIEKFVKHFNLGIVAKGFTGRDLADAVLTLRKQTIPPSDTADLRPYEWPQSERILLTIYKNLLNGTALPISQPLPHYADH